MVTDQFVKIKKLIFVCVHHYSSKDAYRQVAVLKTVKIDGGQPELNL